MQRSGWVLGMIAALVGLTGSLSACSLSGAPPTAPAPPTVRASPTPALPTPVAGLVVTVLATDVGLWRQPDTRGGNVTVSFTVNGNPI